MNQPEFLNTEVKGELRGIPLPSFLQMCENDNKTCALKVTSGQKKGSVVLYKGLVYSAETSAQTSEDAVVEMFAWRDTHIEFIEMDLLALRKVERPLLQMMSAYLDRPQQNRISRKTIEQYRDKLKETRYRGSNSLNK